MLPKIQQPLYTTTLPISKKTVKYRPFILKEEKIILIALAGEDNQDLVDAIDQIITNCTEGQVSAYDLNIIDLSFLIIKIRSAAKGGIVEIGMRCKNKVKEKVCNTLNTVSVNTDDLILTHKITPDKQIDLNETIGVTLKLPGLESIVTEGDESRTETEVLASIIDTVYDENGVYQISNEPKEDVIEFVESLSEEQLDKIDKYLKDIPQIKVDIPFVCEKCGYTEKIEVKDFQNFF